MSRVRVAVSVLTFDRTVGERRGQDEEGELVDVVDLEREFAAGGHALDEPDLAVIASTSSSPPALMPTPADEFPPNDQKNFWA